MSRPAPDPDPDPRRATPLTGAPCAVELVVVDPAVAVGFYTALFGWSAEDDGDTIALRHHGALVGRASHLGPPLAKPTWLVHLAADDPVTVAETAVRQGGSVVGNAGPAPHAVTVRDPGGALVGARRPGGTGDLEVHHDPGTPAWFELHARDFDATVAFYNSSFGWAGRTVTSSGALAYCTLLDGDTRLAGIMDATDFLPDGDDATWSVYFATADLEADLRTAVGAGGTVVLPALATPGGRIAEVEDTAGCRFLLLEQPS
jgi:hypothetical protein